MSILTGATIEASDMNLTVPIGVPLPYFGASAPTDHLICDGSTIGDATSGATARANADTEALFTLLWNSISNTELVIQDSAGSNTTRGASAAADFAAHKRMPLPDLRGYVLAGYKSGHATFGTLGDQVGEDEHTLTTDEIPAHTHTLNNANNLSGAGTAVSQGGSANTGGTVTANNAGGGLAHNNIQKSFTINWVVRYKQYA